MKLMKKKFPQEYISKIEVILVDTEQELKRCKDKLSQVTQENQLLLEDIAYGKNTIAHLTHALKKQGGDGKAMAGLEQDHNGLPMIVDDPNEDFAGDLSSIYINPNELSVNMQSNRFSLVKPAGDGTTQGNIKGSVLEVLQGLQTDRFSNLQATGALPTQHLRGNSDFTSFDCKIEPADNTDQ